MKSDKQSGTWNKANEIFNQAIACGMEVLEMTSPVKNVVEIILGPEAAPTRLLVKRTTDVQAVLKDFGLAPR